MKTIPNKRNVGIFAHVDAGKTTTTEVMLFESGHTRTMGSVDAGTAQTDSMELEKERGISIRAAVTRYEWKNVTINLIDTPGHVDFLSEVERSIGVMDGAVLIISAKEGIQAQSEIIWHALRKLNIPTILYINKMDRIGVELTNVMEEIEKSLTTMSVVVQKPEESGQDFKSTFPLTWESESIPTPYGMYGSIIEKIAEYDEEILNDYIAEKSVNPAHLKNKLNMLVKKSMLFPVLFGASSKGIGVVPLMDAIIDYLPPPSVDEEQALSGIVFKIERDKVLGRMAYVRLYTGKMENRDPVWNFTQNIEEKITQIRSRNGQKIEDTGVLTAGDIAVVSGLNQAKIGDILGVPHAIPNKVQLAVPLLTVQVYWQNDQDYPSVVAALHELSDEDPQLDVQWLQDERELHLKVMGAIQLEILNSVFSSRFGLDVSFGHPSIIYKETPKHAGEGYIAYTMPKPCWAILRFSIEPGERGSGIVYHSEVRTEDLLGRYQNEVERRIPEALMQGLYGWEVTDLKIVLTEGQHHVWHTHPLDFAIAVPMGIMKGLADTETKLLEPLLQFRLSIPEEFSGKILNELAQMRATFKPPSLQKERMIIEGIVPATTSLDYPITLASLTKGRGAMAASFYGYAECPKDVAAQRQRRGVNPLDQSKYILQARKALSNV